MLARLKVFLMALGAIAVWALPVQADPGRSAIILCYVWADQPSSALNVAYTPSPIYSYNFVGRDGANSVTRTAVGNYTVRCKGVGGASLTTSAAAVSGESLEETSVSTEAYEAGSPESKAAAPGEKASSWGPGGHVQVTAYGGEDADQCKVVSWGTGGADFSATVKCFNYKGKAADNRFDLQFSW